MKSGDASGACLKKLSHVSVAGAMIRSFPTARTFTCLTSSENRSSAGSLTAWVRLLVNTVLVVIMAPPLRIWHEYIATCHEAQCQFPASLKRPMFGFMASGFVE